MQTRESAYGYWQLSFWLSNCTQFSSRPLTPQGLENNVCYKASTSLVWKDFILIVRKARTMAMKSLKTVPRVRIRDLLYFCSRSVEQEKSEIFNLHPTGSYRLKHFYRKNTRLIGKLTVRWKAIHLVLAWHTIIKIIIIIKVTTISAQEFLLMREYISGLLHLV